MSEITTDTILDWLKESIEEKKPVSPTVYIDACQKLNILRSTDDDLYAELQHRLAEFKAERLKKGDTVASAKLKAEATELNKEANKQKAKIERITEAIRISKIRARLGSDEIKGY